MKSSGIRKRRGESNDVNRDGNPETPNTGEPRSKKKRRDPLTKNETPTTVPTDAEPLRPDLVRRIPEDQWPKIDPFQLAMLVVSSGTGLPSSSALDSQSALRLLLSCLDELTKEQDKIAAYRKQIARESKTAVELTKALGFDPRQLTDFPMPHRAVLTLFRQLLRPLKVSGRPTQGNDLWRAFLKHHMEIHRKSYASTIERDGDSSDTVIEVPFLDKSPAPITDADITRLEKMQMRPTYWVNSKMVVEFANELKSWRSQLGRKNRRKFPRRRPL